VAVKELEGVHGRVVIAASTSATENLSLGLRII